MDRKRKVKGFTLIELVIVIAIFSIILALVMSFISPVSKVMKKASTRERTSAYVDNIAEYVNNSLHYAKFIKVYDGGFDVSEGEAITALLYDSLNGAVDKNKAPIKGRVRVLKFINGGDDPDASATMRPGQIYESVYEFTAGDRIDYKDTYDNLVYKEITPPSFTQVQDNKPIINEEHLQNYNFYYKPGYYDFEKVVGGTGSTFSERTYTRTKKEYDEDGNESWQITAGNLDITNNDSPYFGMGVVSYLNEEDGSGHYVYRNGEVFENPSYMTTVSMPLVNANGGGGKYKRRAFVETFAYGSADDAIVNTNRAGANSTNAYKANDFADVETTKYYEYRSTGVNNDVYIVFINPDEIYDSKIAYK